MLGLGLTNLKGGALDVYSPTKCYDFGEDTDNRLSYWQIKDAGAEKTDPWHKDTWSMHMWIKPNNETTLSPIYTHVDSATDGVQIWLNTSETLIVKINNTAKTASSACTAGAWNHIFISLNNSTNTLKAFLNGSEVISDTNYTEASDVASEFRYIGYNPNFGGANDWFSGKIFDWAVWKSDKTSDVALFYNNGNYQDMRLYNPYFWYSFGNHPFDNISSVHNFMDPSSNRFEFHSINTLDTALYADDVPTN